MHFVEICGILRVAWESNTNSHTVQVSTRLTAYGLFLSPKVILPILQPEETWSKLHGSALKAIALFVGAHPRCAA